ncbi:tyramine/octopamine receptor-like [Centruroides sculpturatus]|uniref:tyramine/octopamine receptor-like n=1 Tax=Centruroides sculpturatus TaxID=218467 RepID=UPI000C6E9C7D|nr:tyramine/octopamine receptor-like [Centruroides sculpturatus]
MDAADKSLKIIGAIVCSVAISVTFVGNILVIEVVAKFRRLRTVPNFLLAGLATADIAVALLVMPLLIVYDVERKWRFGSIACHFWISCDVMCCTASILHLCVIALDRFFAITRPLRYRSLISKRLVTLVIMSIWLFSATISFIPIFLGWYSDGSDPEDITECSLRVNPIYAIVSSCFSFYLPLPVMFYVYIRILIIAEHQAREIKQLELSLQATNQNVRKCLRRKSKQLITDTKAIRTLGIIMGVFCICWLPFFLMYIILPYCERCDVSYEVRSAITWLGYFNSFFNPCIYAFLNKDFKEAFRRVLCCKKDTEMNGAALEEVSSASRSCLRVDKLQHDVVTPELRTPSITSEMAGPVWPSIVSDLKYDV